MNINSESGFYTITEQKNGLKGCSDRFEKARQDRKERIAAGRFRKDFMDAVHWMDLARKLYVRLPAWDIEVTVDKMRFYLRKYRILEKTYLEATGYDKLEDFKKLNPDWPLRAWLGMLLEYVNERDENLPRTLRAYDR